MFNLVCLVTVLVVNSQFSRGNAINGKSNLCKSVTEIQKSLAKLAVEMANNLAELEEKIDSIGFGCEKPDRVTDIPIIPDATASPPTKTDSTTTTQKFAAEIQSTTTTAIPTDIFSSPDTILLIGGGFKGGGRTSSILSFYPANKTISDWQFGSLSTPRKHHVAAVIDDSLVVAGGEISGVGRTNSTEVFAKTRGRLDDTPEMTTRRMGAAAAVVGGKSLFVCGGRDWRNVLLDSCDVFSPETNSWQLVSETMPVSLFHNAAVAFSKYLYIIGGVSHQLPMDRVYRYDTVEKKWEEMSPMLQERWGHRAVFARDQHGEDVIIACGGWNGERRHTHLSSCEQYSIRLNIWASFPRMVETRMWFGLVQWKRKLFAMGGFADGTHKDSIEEYSFDTGKWSLSSVKMPKARYHFVAQTFDG